MALQGSGAVAIWHDIAPEGRDEFYAWHGKEHMPERVGIPGFLRGRRYVAIEADLEFFNLYEAESTEVLSGPDYLARLNAPTPWTQAAVQHFRNVSRSICRLGASFGHGQGGLCATWRYDVRPGEEARHVEALSSQLLPALAEHGAVAGAHLLIADADASAVQNAEERARARRNLVPGWIVMVEGWGDASAFGGACRDALPDAALAGIGAEGPIGFGTYQLQATIDRLDLA